MCPFHVYSASKVSVTCGLHRKISCIVNVGDVKYKSKGLNKTMATVLILMCFVQQIECNNPYKLNPTQFSQFTILLNIMIDMQGRKLDPPQSNQQSTYELQILYCTKRMKILVVLSIVFFSNWRQLGQ